MSKKIDENFFRSKGFTQLPDGSWGKQDSSHNNPPSGGNAQPNKGEQKCRERTQDAPNTIRRIIAIVTVRTVRPRDYDGLGAASKHYMDALQQCGLYADDSPEHLEVIAVAERVGSFQEEETIIELYELPT